MAKDQDKLLHEIQRLEQQNRTLTLRVQGVQVLGKVLQESQDENSKLRYEVTELKEQLTESGIDASQLSMRTTPSLQQPRCFLSQREDISPSLTESSYNEPFEVVPPISSIISNPGSTTEEQSIAASPGHDFHIKDLTNGVKTIKDQSELLLQQANEMYCTIQNVTNPQERIKLSQRISAFLQRLAQHVKDANTRETLLHGLANEEEQLKEKVLAIENEQFSQEKVMENLKVQLKDDTEELQGIQEELKLFGEAVFVNEKDISLESISSSVTASSTTSTHTSLSSPSIKKFNQAKVESEVTVTKPSCERCFELIQQLKQADKLKKEAERQKEEILDVNHAWDAQYKKLKSETAKEIKDLKHQVEFFKTADTQKKFESLRNSYKKVIDDERMMKEQALCDKMKIEEKRKELEDENRKLSLQIRAQQKQPQTSMYGVQATPLSSLAAQSGESSDVVKEIEVLKQQLRVYADDFNCERQDRERMQGEKEQAQAEMKEANEKITVLKEQLNLYEEDFRKETQEKDRLRRQLTNRESTEPETRFSEMTRKAQVVAERRAKLRALRDEYNREERRLLNEQQDLQQHARVMAAHPESQLGYRDERRILHEQQDLQQSQQGYHGDLYRPRRSWQSEPLRPRGARPADQDMFYGGDVQPDNRVLGREVPDSSSPRVEQYSCPRCFRSYPSKDIESYSKHIEKCIE